MVSLPLSLCVCVCVCVCVCARRARVCVCARGWAGTCAGGVRFSNSNRIIPSDYRILHLLKMPIPIIYSLWEYRELLTFNLSRGYHDKAWESLLSQTGYGIAVHPLTDIFAWPLMSNLCYSLLVWLVTLWGTVRWIHLSWVTIISLKGGLVYGKRGEDDELMK